MEKKIHLVARQPQKPKLLRVVGYARVSSGKEAMLHSLAAQVDSIAVCSLMKRSQVQRKNVRDFKSYLKNVEIMRWILS